MSCTCTWSLVRTNTVDPPHIVKRDRDCLYHGDCPDCGEPLNDGYCVCGYDVDEPPQDDE